MDIVQIVDIFVKNRYNKIYKDNSNMRQDLRKLQFKDEAMTPSNPKWENAITRIGDIYQKRYESRS